MRIRLVLAELRLPDNEPMAVRPQAIVVEQASARSFQYMPFNRRASFPSESNLLLGNVISAAGRDPVPSTRWISEHSRPGPYFFTSP